ncbi:MAG: hypothetical protein EAZ43_01130 [Betaproteobacteria bacterium]|nr:MAG: hypothetical protein EAZ43_01130 [Betaproteobacteria bacterium]
MRAVRKSLKCLTLTWAFSNAAMDRIACNYFNGIDSTAHRSTLQYVGQSIQISGDWGSALIAITDITISDRLGNAPRTISLPNGAACELDGGAETNAFLSQFAAKESPWFRAQFDWRWAAASIAALAVFAVAGYRWGVPLASDFLAARVPKIALEKMSDVALLELDRTVLNPSKLPEARQRDLAERFAKMKPPGGTAIAHRVEFRNAEKYVGPNAFALPSGIIVMTDQLVELMQNDEQILGVLAHELGHVEHQHGMRNVIQASFIGAAVAYWLGDVSSVLAGGTTALLHTKYSRQYETEADDFGAAMMRANGLSPTSLAIALEALEGRSRRQNADNTGTESAKSEGKQAAETPKRSARSRDWSDYISTHPNTAERAERLRQ